MTSALEGDPLWAVLIPPRLARFRTLVGIGGAPLEVNVTGWNKLVILSADRAFLFPREARNIEWFHRELTVYEALAAIGLPIVPRVIDRWHEEDVYPLPFAAVMRLEGTHPDDASTLLEELGTAIAKWHAPAPPHLPGARPPAHHERADTQWLRRALDPATTRASVAEAADRLGRREDLEHWTQQLEIAAQHPPVLVHGDIHEDQLLAVDGRLTGILDWETARVDHPFWDFDFGEWSTGLWRRHRHDFSRLWSTAWRAYADARGLDPDPTPLETAFRIRHALFLLDTGGDAQVVGTIEEHLRCIAADRVQRRDRQRRPR
jgi:aminoglycoside phosphotransferase (APT) family kinase protein